MQESNRDCPLFMNPRHALAFGIVVTIALGADAPVKITPEKVRESCKTFTRVTKEPKSIGAEFAVLCWEPPGVEQMRKETGPHAMHYLHYYLNEVAQRHRESRVGGAYPPGSVIVKEKLFEGTGKLAAEPIVSAVAGMIKREPGSSPQTRDWEFFYLNPPSVDAKGKPIEFQQRKDLKSCAGCHSNAPDMVFGRFEEPCKMPKPGVSGKATPLEIAPADGLPIGPKK